MKIGIYNECVEGGIGGSEFYVAVMAEALSQNHEVDLVYHKSALTANGLSTLFSTDLSRVHLRYLEPHPYSFGDSRNPVQRYHEARAWNAAFSERYDLFVNVTHSIPAFCHAPRGALIVLFPFQKPMHKQFLEESKSPLIKHFKNFYHEWEWKKRFDSYQVKASISQFTRSWTKQWWDIDSQVLYPPAGGDFGIVDKHNAILSVGRFATQAHTKKQMEMVTAYQQIKESGANGWNYFCVGGLTRMPEDQAFFADVQRAGAACGAQVLANLELGDLKRLYEESKIFWHATGYGIDDAAQPELAEHYGISTVEAMAAGCVPIVISKGGQKEIVQHGVDGFLWNTLEELKHYTVMVMRDEPLRERMSDAARGRAAHFSRAQFVDRSMKMLQPLMR